MRPSKPCCLGFVNWHGQTKYLVGKYCLNMRRASSSIGISIVLSGGGVSAQGNKKKEERRKEEGGGGRFYGAGREGV